MTYQPEEKVQLRVDDVVWRGVGDEIVILELSTSTYLTLNGTATHLWDGLVDGSTMAELAEILTMRYRITVDQARADVEAFVAALSDRNLLLPAT